MPTQARQAILMTPGMVEAIKDALGTAESPRTCEVAKGVLWTLGKKMLHVIYTYIDIY